jgi:hypothetical protein
MNFGKHEARKEMNQEIRKTGRDFHYSVVLFFGFFPAFLLSSFISSE